MGTCTSKPPKQNPYSSRDPNDQSDPSQTPKSLPSLTPHHNSKDDAVSGARQSQSQSPFFPFYSPSPAHYFKKSPATTKSKSAASTPSRFFRRPFPPPSPAKHIKAVLARRLGKKATASVAIPEDGEDEDGVDRSFHVPSSIFDHTVAKRYIFYHVAWKLSPLFSVLQKSLKVQRTKLSLYHVTK